MEDNIRFKVKCDKHLPPSSDVPQVREVIFVLLKHPLVPLPEIVFMEVTTRLNRYGSQPGQALFGPAFQCYVCIMILDHQFSFGPMAQLSHADSRWN